MIEDRFKFRFWIAHDNEMVDWDTANQAGFNGPGHKGDVNLLYSLMNDTSIPKMQCTGLKDSEGKLVYEGDILNGYFGNLKTVEFSNGGFGYRDFIGFSNHDNLKKFLGCHKIIGNIYENPELVESQNG